MKLSDPVKPELAVYVNEPVAFRVSEPFGVVLTRTAVAPDAPVSLPSTPGAEILNVVPWVVVKLSLAATGPALDACRVTLSTVMT